MAERCEARRGKGKAERCLVKRGKGLAGRRVALAW